MKFWTPFIALSLAACATVPPAPAPLPTSPVPLPPVEVQILAINDFHGNLEPPQSTIPGKDAAGKDVFVPAGGAAYLAGALKQLRAGHPHTITVAAGDLIGGTPITSSLFLDEPSIVALNMAGLDLASVGNHEFDKGSAELVRMQRGGCAKHTSREPCAVDKDFPGARFGYLAANVQSGNGQTLFPATAVRDFGPIRIGFIGMTLKETGILVTPSGVAGLTFADEAATANALVPQLKAQGADAIVVLLHQGAFTKGHWSDPTCPGLSGDVLPILEQLDPAIEVVVSGHTHWAYRCDMPLPNGRTRLLTSAGRYGTMLADIRLTFDAASEALRGKNAALTIVQGEPFTNSRGASPLVQAFPVYPADPEVKALVDRYVAAAKPQAERVVARLSAPLLNDEDQHRAKLLGQFVADAQLAWTRPKERGGAQMAFMNNGGVRADLTPDSGGNITFGQLFAVQPVGNGIVVQTLTGAQIKQLLEQGFAKEGDPTMMMPSAGVAYVYDLKRPAGQRIVSLTFNGKPLDPNARYRVTTNSFLASGGDGFAILTEGTDRVDAGLDLDALEAFMKTSPRPPSPGRVRDTDPQAAAAS